MKNLLPLIPIFYLLLAIAAGWFIATQANNLLAISFEDKDLPRTPQLRSAELAEPQQTTWPYLVRFEPYGSMPQDQIVIAVNTSLSDALGTHGLDMGIIDSNTPPFAESITIQTNATISDNPDAFRIAQSEGGGILVEGATDLATAYGVYHLADRILAGDDLTSVDKIIEPDLRYRYVDMSGVGVKAGEELWDSTDYSHHSRAFEHVILAEAPYIDETAFAQVESEYQAYIQQMISYGYNGIIINGYMEYINFDGVGDGFDVYPADSDYRRRHLVLRERLGDMYSYAADQGMSVVFKTDMLALTEPLETYLINELGGLDANDPRLWAIYRAGLAEFYEQMPFVDGMMIRIGEAGAIYNLEGWNYYSGLHVTTDVAVQRMLNELGAVSAENNKNIYFRTWSIGVGNVGDIHTNPDTYMRVLGDGSLDGLNNLVVSTKHTKGDFDAWLPQNPTLKVGDQPRIIEMQARREFENFNVFPNYMTPEHQVDLQDFLAENGNIDGVWMWTDGGPWRSGPYLLYTDHGYTDMIDVNMYTGAQLAWDVNADTTTLAEQWVRRTISTEPQTVQTVTQMLLDSREVVRQSYYIEPFAQKDVRAFGLEVPPMFWLFKWDIVSGSPSALGAVYNVVSDDSDDVESAIGKGAEAMDQLERMQIAVSDLNDPNLDMLTQSLDYEQSVFGTLQAYRKAFLHYFKWLDTGTGAWSADLTAFDAAKNDHLATYGESAQFPALNFFAAEQLQTFMHRTPLMVWLARALFALLIALILTAPTIREAIFTPWHISNDVDNRLVWIVAIIALLLGRMIFTSFTSWAYLLWFGLALLVYLILGRLWSNGDTYHTTTVLTAMLAPLLLRMAILIGIVAFRGPFFFWFRLWMNEPFRTLYIIINVMTLMWLLAILFMLMRNVGGMSIWGAVGLVLASIGAFLLITGILPMPLGLDRTLTLINDQMLVIPVGLSRILGITTHLGIPVTLPRILTIAGTITLGAGFVLRLLTNR